MPTTWGIHSDGLREKRQQGEGRQSNIVQVQVAVAVNDQVEVEVVSTGREGIRFCRNHRAPVHFVEKRRSPPISGNDRVSA
jgi:hypothetical protein